MKYDIEYTQFGKNCQECFIDETKLAATKAAIKAAGGKKLRVVVAA